MCGRPDVENQRRAITCEALPAGMPYAPKHDAVRSSLPKIRPERLRRFPAIWIVQRRKCGIVAANIMKVGIEV
jgi:hypothetical protein